MRNAITVFTLSCLCLTSLSGCAAWTDKSKNKDSMWSSMQFWKKPYQKPDKMAAIWTHDILTMSGKPPTRGFGGRIYFYNPKSQAIPVEGELIVHGYEEKRLGLNAPEAKTQADKTFMFTAEQFTEHYSPSDLGASYSIWIPWDPADGVQKEITLIPTFKGKDGVILQGEPAKLVLPGRRPEDPFASAALQHVSIQQSQTATNMGPLPQLSGLKTTTISMPATANRVSRDSSNVINMGSTASHQNNLAQPNSQQSARAAALYDAMLAQRNQQYVLGNSGTTVAQQATVPANSQLAPAQLTAYPSYPAQNYATPNHVAPAYSSSMPNMLQAQQAQVQPAGTVVNGMQINAGYALPAMTTPGNVLPGAIPGMVPGSNNAMPTALPGSSMPGSSMPMMQMPGMQQPGQSSVGGQPAIPQPNWGTQLTPGVATQTPIQPGAVQAAFATVQGVPPQWQPFAPTQGSASTVQSAAFSSPQIPNGFNQAPVLAR